MLVPGDLEGFTLLGTHLQLLLKVRYGDVSGSVIQVFFSTGNVPS